MPNTFLHETRDHAFRFMDSPVDLRLIVYEWIPRVVKHTPLQLTSPLAGDNTSTGLPELILITRHVSTAILATCSMVHTEADSIVKRLLKTFILEQEPKIVIRIDSTLNLICAIVSSISSLSRFTTVSCMSVCSSTISSD
jgi:hypothetical protein